LLSARSLHEPSQALTSLGALSPHFANLGIQGFDFAALAADPTKNLEISVSLQLSQTEIDLLHSNSQSLAMSLLLSRLVRPEFQRFELTQFLSTKDGQDQLADAQKDATSAIQSYRSDKPLDMKLTINAGSNSFSGNDLNAQQAVALLDRLLPAQLTKFSYFPADRSLPQGEIAIQLGSAEAQNQLAAHMAVPATKYGRLKVSIAQSVLLGNLGVSDVKKIFDTLFAKLIPGKEFDGLIMNDVGVMKIMIKEISTKKRYDIDCLSSGEKGLVATFLLALTSMSEGSILLLDEPELHLNPAVTKSLLSFIQTELVKKKQCQVFLCTHSPEVLGDAFETDECALFHLRSGTDLSPVYRRDETEVLDILDRLGVTTADVLFSKGNIFVEGVHDDEILSEGFNNVVGGYKITPMGGRNEIVKEIKQLESAPSKMTQLKLFIFDRDRKPSDLQGKGSVVVRQWERYCLENYLLDEKPLFAIVTEYAATRPESRGSFQQLLKADAIAQTEQVAVSRTYQSLEPGNAGIRRSEHKGKSIPASADVLIARLEAIKAELNPLNSPEWKTSFIEKATNLQHELATEWDTTWKVEADGKALIDALYERYQIKIDKLAFKKKVVNAMRVEQTETWRAVSGILSDAINAGS